MQPSEIVVPNITPGRDWYLSSFQAFEKNLNGAASSHLHAIRKAAIARFAELGFPSTREEEWKYTDVAPLTRVNFKPVLNNVVDGLTMTDLERSVPLCGRNLKWDRLVWVNGHFSKEISSISALQAGVKIGSLADAMRHDPRVLEEHLAQYARYEENAFTALSTAFLQDGAFIYVPNGVLVQAPIHLLFLSTNLGPEFVSYPRNLIIIGKNSQVAIVETHASLADNMYFTNAVTEIVLGENAVLEYDKVQVESVRSFHIGTTHAHQGRSSTLISNSISFGGALVRNNLTAVLDGDGVECTLNGLYLAAGQQHIDNHTTIDHAKPHCNSHELYKGVLAGKSRGVFNGKIIVRKNAQKTDARQTNKNLVLTDDAAIDTKPQLEIFADDVKCTHGATIGQLDEEAIFYLRSRGVGFNNARDILIGAFASDVINRIKIEPLREQLHQMLHARLGQEFQRGDL
ncbi:MAG: Fe-S cluster assembly protein SufD [Bacteroidota bacterium]